MSHFPGMDPYLEDPKIFPGIHGPMITYLRDQLALQIKPRYVASVGERVYLESPSAKTYIPDVSLQWITVPPPMGLGGGAAVMDEVEPAVELELPDLEVKQPFIEILDSQSGMQVVTVIELISPSNKYAGNGRDSYLSKQREIRWSAAHLVEIDLLRRGPHVLAASEWAMRGKYTYDYAACVNRAHGGRSRYEVYMWTLRRPIPRIAIPLAGNDPDVSLDLRSSLVRAYDAGSYRQRIDYKRPCEPALHPEDQAWADALLVTNSDAKAL